RRQEGGCRAHSGPASVPPSSHDDRRLPASGPVPMLSATHASLRDRPRLRIGVRGPRCHTPEGGTWRTRRPPCRSANVWFWTLNALQLLSLPVRLPPSGPPRLRRARALGRAPRRTWPAGPRVTGLLRMVELALPAPGRVLHPVQLLTRLPARAIRATGW